MKDKSVFMNLQHLITRDQNFLFTILSYITILIIFVNTSLTNSPAMGLVASAIYFLINATYFGHALFKREDLFVRFMLGNLLLIAILGLVAWAVMILYNLGKIGSLIVLSIADSLASFLNRKAKSKNATY